MLTRILLRRDTNENWTRHNPVLAQGEIGVDVTSNLFKLGDGKKSWTELNYYSNGGGQVTLNYEMLENKPYINGVELTGNVTLEDLGIIVPTKTSQLTNDSDFITSVALNQYPTASEVTEALETKQDVLTAGANVKIENNVISVNGVSGESKYKGEYSDAETYTKGDCVSYYDQFHMCCVESVNGFNPSYMDYWKRIDNTDIVQFSNTDGDQEYFIGLVSPLAPEGLRAGFVEYSINAPKVNAATGELIGYATTQQMTNELSTKQDRLIPGDGIIIEDNVISSVGGGSGGTTITMRDWSN
jgi:hypothetical protein